MDRRSLCEANSLFVGHSYSVIAVSTSYFYLDSDEDRSLNFLYTSQSINRLYWLVSQILLGWARAKGIVIIENLQGLTTKFF